MTSFLQYAALLATDKIRNRSVLELNLCSLLLAILTEKNFDNQNRDNK